MKNFTTIAIAVSLAIVTLLNFGCGTTDNGRNYDAYTGFAVSYINIDSTTGKIIEGQPLRVTFTEPIMASTASTTNITVEYYASTGDMSSKKTLSSQFSLADGNMTLVITPIGSWPIDSTIMVTFGRGFLSTNSNALSGQTVYWACTGSTNVFGSISLPGKPQVLSVTVTNYTPWNDNLAFLVEFNEDLNVAPSASAKLKLFNELTESYIPLISWPVYETSRRFYYLLFSDCGCSSTLFVIGRNIIIDIFNARDMTYDMMNTYEQKFDFLDDYFGSECSIGYSCIGG